VLFSLVAAAFLANKDVYIYTINPHFVQFCPSISWSV